MTTNPPLPPRGRAVVRTIEGDLLEGPLWFCMPDDVRKWAFGRGGLAIAWPRLGTRGETPFGRVSRAVWRDDADDDRVLAINEDLGSPWWRARVPIEEVLEDLYGDLRATAAKEPFRRDAEGYPVIDIDAIHRPQKKVVRPARPAFTVDHPSGLIALYLCPSSRALRWWGEVYGEPEDLPRGRDDPRRPSARVWRDADGRAVAVAEDLGSEWWLEELDPWRWVDE